jgi:UDP-3-O-[3-hydroxymyristoyl] glucosamine N-acyltransferase
VVSPEASIASDASVGAYTTIGAAVRISPGCVIGASCHIGDNCTLEEACRLHDNVTLYHDVSVGRNTILHSGVVVGADGFGFVLAGDRYEKFPQIGRVEIGADVEIGANSCVDRAALGVTRVGNGVKIDNLVQIAHNVSIGDHTIIVSQAGISGGSTIGNYVVIAGQVGLGEKANIEDKAVLGGQCGVLPSKTVPAGQTMWGTPARPIREHLAALAQIGKIAALREKVADLARRVAKLEG